MPLYPKLAYHPERDFEPVTLLAGTPILILARKDFPAKDLKEFIAYVKANTDKMNMAHAGVGSVSYSSCELLSSVLDIKPVGVPFNGTGRLHKYRVASSAISWFMCSRLPTDCFNSSIRAIVVRRASTSISLAAFTYIRFTVESCQCRL